MAKIDSYQFWLDQLVNRSEATRESYLIYFRKFTEFAGQGPDELIELQRKAFQSEDDPRENRVVETLVRRWLAELGENKSSATCRSALSAVRSFFNVNLHPLRLNSRDNPRGDSVGSRIPEKHEVIEVADAAKWKYRAGVMFLKDSGLRISDVVRVRWKDFKDFGDGFWHFNLVTQKRRVAACCFVGPETTRLLTQFPTKTDRVFNTKAGTFDIKINHYVKVAGVEGVTAHGFRKYFKASMEHARTPENYILHMMGKRSSVYSEKRVSQLFEAYRKAYPDLAVYAQKEQTEEMDQLKKRIRELEHQRFRHDKILEDIEQLMELPGAREVFEEVARALTEKVDKTLRERGLGYILPRDSEK